MKKRGVEYAAFCDIAEDKHGTWFCGHEVISPEKLRAQYPEAAVLITAVFYETIYEMLWEAGYREIYDCTSLFMEIDFSGYDFWASEEYSIRNVEQALAAILEQKSGSGRIDQIFLNITTRCSLRCRDCSLFIPYVESPCDYDADMILADLKKVLDCLGYVRIVNFYGGEPLLHPELGKMIRTLREEKRIDRISIITNGTIIPSEEVIQAIKQEERFMVRLSDYGRLGKVEELARILSEHNISYEISNYTYWDRPSSIAKFAETDQQLREKFIQCTACNVLFLLNRKGYLCSTGSAVCNIGGFPESTDNYMDLAEEKDFEERLKNYIGKRKRGEYLDACRYCSGVHGVQFEKKVPVAVQTKSLMRFPDIEVEG